MSDMRMPRAIKILAPLLVAVVLAVTSLAAQGTLLGRDINGNPTATNDDPNAVFEYDTDFDITWLRDWNVNGPMDWDTAVAWAAGLTVGNYSDWRLPTNTTCNPGYNCTSSEMGHVWYTELGNSVTFTNSGPFLNMQSLYYWLGTEPSPNSLDAWTFDVRDGAQGFFFKFNAFYAVAVRAGDVAAAAVPEPGSLALVLGAMVALAAARRRRPR